MSGERDLQQLLASLEPQLDPTPYVFLNIPSSPPPPPARQATDFEDAHAAGGEVHPAAAQLQAAAIVTVLESEGLTLVVPRATADAAGYSKAYSYVCQRITLTVHSSLEAVGLTAAFATRLGQHGISANVVAGFYHDHIFVAASDAERAIKCLHELAEDAKKAIS